MAELLVDAKRAVLAERGVVTEQDFDEAWRAAWDVMVCERAWPHASEHRRQWRQAMVATRAETRAAFVGRRTVFGDLAEALAAAGARMNVTVEPEDLPRLVIGAIGRDYLSDPQPQEAAAA